jgi:hypothetical protein
MAKRIKTRKCRNCRTSFRPDSRNAWHQQYCKKPECRKASKAASQRRWLAKEENRDHFRGPLNVQRVQEWRREHPGYWRPKPPEVEPLQDLISKKPMGNPWVEASLEESAPDLLSEKSPEIPTVEPVSPKTPERPLQDLVFSQQAVLIGLISQMIGSALQDHVALTAQRLQQLGTDILNTQCKGETHDPKATHLPTSYPQGPQPVQLGGPPPGS